MNRRDSLKALGLTALSTTVLVAACKPSNDKKVTIATKNEAGREGWETERDEKFIVKDMPDHQVPLRGGLKWLDIQSFNRFEKSFIQASEKDQISLIDEIAYPNKAKPEMLAGVSFFNRMRSLTASGFYTTEIGVKDIGYVGNTPNQWNGVPQEILKQYGMENVNI